VDTGYTQGEYATDAKISGKAWRVEVHGETPAAPYVPEDAVIATWAALSLDCRDCGDHVPCPSHRAEATQVAAATLKAARGVR
jgi:hypothetical protein